MQKPLEELREKLPDVEVSYSYGYYIAGEDESHFEEALEKIKRGRSGNPYIRRQTRNLLHVFYGRRCRWKQY